MSPLRRSHGVRSVVPPGPRVRVSVLLAFALGIAACASNVRDPFAFARGERDYVRIEVVNLNFADATLHVHRGGERQRLGTVTGKGQASYRIDWPMSLPMQIEIDLLAGGSCTSRPLQVDPGDIVDLQIQVEMTRYTECTPTSRRG